MVDFQKYLIEDTIIYTPSLLAIGLSSGSDEVNGSVAFDSYVQNSYPLSEIIDGDDSTFSVFESTTPSGHTGFDIDLRIPFEADVSLSIYNNVADAKIEEYDPAGNAYQWTLLQRIYDGNGSTSVYDFGLGSGEVFGFTITFNTPTALNRFEITPSSNDATAYTYTVEISFNGTDYITDSTFTMSSVDVAKSVDIRYRSDYDSDDGQQQKGNLENKKIKKLRISSTGNSINTDVRFSELDLFRLEYEHPEGVYLNKIRSKNSFGSGTSGTWDYQVSYDGESFESMGNLSKSGYATNDFVINSIDKKVKIFRLVNQADTADERIFNAEVHYWPDTFDLVDFDFNDSVLETKAWKSSRYDGRQLTAQKLNKISKDDIGNNNKTPIIRNYTRNIYIGNEIVGMNEFGGDDETLTQFPDFSYAQINTYITVNEDGTITSNTLDPEANNDDQKKAFYRPFTRDFPEGSFCNFILGDPTVKNNLRSKYPIYFNGGQLKKLITLQTKSGPDDDANGVSGYANGGTLLTQRVDPDAGGANDISNVVGANASNPLGVPILLGPESALYIGGRNTVYLDDTTTGFPAIPATTPITASLMTSSLHNEDIYNAWFTGSIEHGQSYFFSPSAGMIPTQVRGLNLTELNKFTRNLLSYKSGSSYKGDKRLFITCAGRHRPEYFKRPNFSAGGELTGFDPPTIAGNPKPLYTFEPGSIHTGSAGITTPNLSSLTTLEVSDVNDYTTYSGYTVTEFIFNNQLSRSYIDCHSVQNDDFITIKTSLLTYDKGFVPNFNTGSFMFSITDDDVPSILIPLKKERDLPRDKGEKPFVVIPENIHPYVKDNLIFYLSKAGIDIGGDATNKVEENNNKRIGKKRILTEAQLRELARRRREARLSRTRRGRRQLRQEERQNRREERREERRENRNERLKERNNRRENRRINKDNRKEKRQDKRETRKQNRRNRRRRR